jgi:hypothetical protein
LNFKHALWAGKGREKGIFEAARAFSGGKLRLSPMPQTADRPASQQPSELIHRCFVKRKREGGTGELFAVTDEYAALAHKPEGGDKERRLIGIGQKTSY